MDSKNATFASKGAGIGIKNSWPNLMEIVAGVCIPGTYSKNSLKSKFINCLIWIFISEGIKAEKEPNWSILQLQSSTLLPNLTKPPMLVEIGKY